MRAEVAVTDAHALIWYACGRFKRLGSAARQVFEDAEAGRAAIFVPTVVPLRSLRSGPRLFDVSGSVVRGLDRWAR